MGTDSNDSQEEPANDNTIETEPSTSEIVGYNEQKEFFEAELASEAKFQLHLDEWIKLKTLQKDHRFMKGEWEDYFIVGMKESNKYCVFAFKDHYVNQVWVRAPKSAKDTVKKDKKLFSAKGYCVFQDCSVEFSLIMYSDRMVHINYTGQLKHSCSEVRGRYFRGKTRRDLSDVLKNSSPLLEFKSKTKNGNEQGNADFVGKTLSVYRRISAEAKDSYQTLLSLRKQYVDISAIQVNKLKLKVDYQSKLFEKTYIKGFIQVIQHMPGTIVCFSHEQVCLYHNIFIDRSSHITVNNTNGNKTLRISDKRGFTQPCLYVNSYRKSSVTSTTINSNELFYYELCVRKPFKINTDSLTSDFSNTQNLIPLSFMLTTNTHAFQCLSQWLGNFFNSEKNLFHSYYVSGKDKQFNCNENIKYIICDNSMPLVQTLLTIMNKQTPVSYSNDCFSYSVHRSKSLPNQNLNSTTISAGLDQEFSELNLSLLRSIASEKSTQLSNYVVHVCTDQVMTEISHLCKFYYSFGNNFTFGMYAFSIIANSQSLTELQQSIYAFMCILYSKSINSLVNKAFNFLKDKVSHFEALDQKRKLHTHQQVDACLADEFFFYNFEQNCSEATAEAEEATTGSNLCKLTSIQTIDLLDENLLIENNLGLVALKRLDCGLDDKRYMYANNLSYNVAKYEDNHLDRMNEESVFYKMCEKLFENCKASIDACEKEELKKNVSLNKNPRQGLKLLFYFIQQFAATLPLWTKLMCPAKNQDFHLPISLDLHRDRLNKLESLTHVNESGEKEGLNSFIKRLHSEDQSLVQENVRIYGLNEREFTFNVWSKQSESELYRLKRAFQYNGRVEAAGVNDNLTQANLSKSMRKSIVIKQTTRSKLLKRNKNDMLKLKSTAENTNNNSRHNSDNEDMEEDEQHKFNLISLSESDLNDRYDQQISESAVEPPVASVAVVEGPVSVATSRKTHLIIEESESEREVVIERQQQILASLYGLELIKEDLETLESPNNLNSNIVEFYIKLLESRVKKELTSKLRVFACPVSFYLTLKYGQNGNNQLTSMDPSFDILDYDLVLVPIQKANHWALAAIDFTKQKITYYDSTLLNDFDCLKHLTEFINKQHLKRFLIKFDFQNWKISNEKNIPRKMSSKESGSFILYFAKRLIFNEDSTVSVEDIEKFRIEIKDQIYQHISS